MIGVYLLFARSVVHTYLSYGVNSVVFTLGGFLRVLLSFYLWMAIFQSSDQGMLAGYTWTEMALYVVMMQFALRLTDADTDGWVGEDVRSGAIAMSLIKPLNYSVQMLFMSLGSLAYEVAFVFTPMVLVLGGVWTMVLGYPLPGLMNMGLFMVSVLLGFLILFSINLSFGFMAFYLKNMWGLGNVKWVTIAFLSGGVIPISFFPSGVQPLLSVLPFSSIHSTPVLICLGKIEGAGVWSALGLQAAWAAGLFLASQIIYRNAVKKLTVQGG